MLQRLLFNLGGVTPEIAGGVSNVCQAFVNHVPEFMTDVEVWALTGSGDWQHRYPLSGPARRLSIAHMSSRRAGKAVERALDPSASNLGLWWRDRLHRLRRSDGYRFPSGWSMNTVVHCPYQVTHPLPPAAWNLPYVINLHDIQHEHFPEFFTPEELTRRRECYLASARHAAAVCVVDEWTRRDVLAHLPIPEWKVFVAPLGPTWPSPEPLTPERRSDLALRHGLPDPFIYYPAQTWPHKNHLRLLDALRALRDRGLDITLICTGHLNEHAEVLKQRAIALGMADRIRFLGLVPGPDVRALYQAACMTVIPTLFEGGPGIPVLEAMALGSPLAASKVCGIPDALGDGGMLFDPLDVADIAAAIGKLWEDGDLRRELSAKALMRSRQRTWSWAARRYADIYAESLNRWNARDPS